MTSNSMFLRSIRYVLSVGAPDRQTRNSRRKGSFASLQGSAEVVEDRCLLSGTSILNGALYSGGNSGNGGPTGNSNPLTSIPVLHSLPGAPVTIYLDFDGHTETSADWTQNGTRAVSTPVYDIDGDLTTFSDEELRRMEEVWYRVSEDFAPFDINVTTVDPGTFNDFQAIRVSIGGDGAWGGAPSGGVAFLDSFSNSASNTCFVFTDNLNNGAAVPTAMNSSHEAGHTLGLVHHSQFDATGNYVTEYDPGNSRIGPIMGGAFDSERNIWVNAPTNVDVNTFQDDLAVITSGANQTVHNRVDDHGNTVQTATQPTITSTTVINTGIIERNDDVDMFRLETNSGNVSFSATGLDVNSFYPGLNLNPGTNLDLVIRLYDATGQLISENNPTNGLNASITTTLGAGVYYIGVSGTGEYGALGQYTLSSTLIPLPSTPTMLGPLGTLSQPLPFFEWTPGANADHYELQVNNLTTNQFNYYTRNVTGTSHLAVSQFVQGDYQARVRTVAADDTFSAWSEYVSFTIDIPAPVKPVVNRPTGIIPDSFPDFGWTGDSFSSTYTLWVNNATTGQRVIYRTSYPQTSYTHFSPLPDGIYRAWVQAFNSLGESSVWSDAVDFTVKAPLAVAPTITAPIAVSDNTSPRIEWNAVDAAAKYDLWVDNLTTGTSQVIRQQNISYLTPYFDATDLPQGTFRAWVRTANGNNIFSLWSSPLTFTIDIPVPSTPTMTAPTGANGSSVVTTANPTFQWTAAVRAVKYDLWVNNVTTGQAQIIRQQSLTDTQYVALSVLPQGSYRAWVRGINSANEVGEWSTVFTFVLDEPVPTVPVIISPASNPAGSVESTTPTFTWISELNAPFYEFRLDDETLNTTSVIRVTNLKTKSYTIPANQQLTEHKYVAMVRGVNSSGEMSNWSAPYRIRIDIPNPSTPTILSPSGSSKDTTPTFEWTHSSSAVRYEILVRDLERSETIVLQVKSFTLDPTGKISSYTLPNSQAFRPGTYRFWIRGFNSLGTASAWSDARAFVISASLDLKALKNVDPMDDQSADEFYAMAELQSEREADVSVPADNAVTAITRVEVPDSPVTNGSVADVMIEEVMTSLSDPTSTASAMLSGARLTETESESDQTSTAAAALLALAVMPARRNRREE
jgi:hypothetical protein